MELDLKNCLPAGATVVSNIFIDEYMAGASGEYVKVYLYLLRHQQETVTAEMAAEALGHTEADVRRALAYWQRVGALRPAGAGHVPGTGAAAALTPGAARVPDTGADTVSTFGAQAPAAGSQRPAAPVSEKLENVSSGAPQARRETAAACDMVRLSEDESFRQLVYIAEKYLNRVLTQTDCRILGNLYSGLGFSTEVLEYLIEYCVQNHHTSLRYAEKVALSWHEKKVRTVEDARRASRGFSKEIFAVMKAMGLGARGPAAPELELIEKWFREYGFTKEIVVEACSRTIRAIQTPSFPYTDRILSDWKAAGVRTFSDVAALDRSRKEKAEKEKGGGGERRINGSRTGGGRGNGARPSNRFHNLEEHGYDYDKMVWSLMNAEQETGGTDGAE